MKKKKNKLKGKLLIISCPNHTESVRKAIKLLNWKYAKVDFLALEYYQNSIIDYGYLG